jgi:acetylornithine deacetylase/succinyl-diaminopimelate desuccinylase-like protein
VSVDHLASLAQTAPDELPVALLQRLVRLDSSNPPGNERPCIELIAAVLERAGIEPRILARQPTRPNLAARIAGRGQAPPLLLYGHADVVPAQADEWRHPPFAGELVDGEVWGRGTLDMKGGLAMLLTAFLRAASGPVAPPGDVLLVVNSDEETGGDLGAQYLVRQHKELFAGVRHALSEFGGYTQHVRTRRLYPIQVAQKRRCTLRLTLRGEGGHSASPHRGQATTKLGLALVAIERRRLPTHITAPVRHMVEAMARGLPAPEAVAVRALLRPRLTDPILRLAAKQAHDLDPLFRNTAAATVIRAGTAENVVPATAQAVLDGRLVPGHDPETLIAEMRAVLSTEAELEILRADPPPPRRTPNLELLPLLSTVLREDDPGGHPFPLVTAGMTDARHYDQLGIQTYGFLPMQLPPGRLPKLLHAPNERVPAAALAAGAAAIGRVIERYRAP